jgi:cyclopropane-fatty-acyl-phospholipid synthase
LTDRFTQKAQELLHTVDVQINGTRPWDLTIHHPDLMRRVFSRGSLGLGEGYMAGWWDCQQIDELIARVMQARLDQALGRFSVLLSLLRARLFNLQSSARAWHVGQVHYDLGNDLYQAMLDPYMAYSCGYWARADNLEQAQQDKLDLVCRKLGLQAGMRLLDIGCGWGSLMRFAAEHYQVECVGLTVSREQAQWGARKMQGLPVRFEFADYRQFNPQGAQKFDRIASVGMFEHVGHKNYHRFFDMARRSLRDDGLFLLHTIGKKRSGRGFDPWLEKYIFPNGVVPSVSEIAQASEHAFVVEDWHNFGADYDKTLMAWYHRFEAAWPRLKAHYGDRFYRMWRYYLLSCAGSFRARHNQLWQVVLSPRGVAGGYVRPSI